MSYNYLSISSRMMMLNGDLYASSKTLNNKDQEIKIRHTRLKNFVPLRR